MTDPRQWDLWAPPHRAADLARWARLAVELAAGAGAAGITVDDLRRAAGPRGLARGDERGRSLSFLGAVCRHAGLEPTDQYRRSRQAASHGNLHRVWRCAPSARAVPDPPTRRSPGARRI